MDAPPKSKTEAWKLNAGRLLSVVALVFCVPAGALFVSVASGAMGIFLGVVGYALGARGIGRLAIVACVAAMLLGLLVGPGVIPGSYDAALNGIEEAIHDPFEGGPQPYRPGEPETA